MGAQTFKMCIQLRKYLTLPVLFCELLPLAFTHLKRQMSQREEQSSQRGSDELSPQLFAIINFVTFRAKRQSFYFKP